MRAYGRYGLLLGTLLTVVYGYTAQAAIARDLGRAGFGKTLPVAESRSAPDDRIWWGGVLAPITVQGMRPEPCRHQPSAIGHLQAARVSTDD
jgi:hypothetical protein